MLLVLSLPLHSGGFRGCPREAPITQRSVVGVLNKATIHRGPGSRQSVRPRLYPARAWPCRAAGNTARNLHAIKGKQHGDLAHAMSRHTCTSLAAGYAVCA